jgi:hypothetical protein
MRPRRTKVKPVRRCATIAKPVEEWSPDDCSMDAQNAPSNNAGSSYPGSLCCARMHCSAADNVRSPLAEVRGGGEPAAQARRRPRRKRTTKRTTISNAWSSRNLGQSQFRAALTGVSAVCPRPAGPARRERSGKARRVPAGRERPVRAASKGQRNPHRSQPTFWLGRHGRHGPALGSPDCRRHSADGGAPLHRSRSRRNPSASLSPSLRAAHIVDQDRRGAF